jgi:serine/threonine-protein kinase RsbW
MENHSFQIESKYREITILVGKLHNLFLENGLDEQDQSELEICIVEALNNVVRHSYKAKPDNFIILELDIDIDENLVVIKIVDTGMSRTDFSKPTLQYDPLDIENLPEGGMGLFIIDRLMDSTNYETEDGKNIFIMTKTFRK